MPWKGDATSDFGGNLQATYVLTRPPPYSLLTVLANWAPFAQRLCDDLDGVLVGAHGAILRLALRVGNKIPPKKGQGSNPPTHWIGNPQFPVAKTWEVRIQPSKPPIQTPTKSYLKGEKAPAWRNHATLRKATCEQAQHSPTNTSFSVAPLGHENYKDSLGRTRVSVAP